MVMAAAVMMMIVAVVVVLRLLHRDRKHDVLLRGVLSVVVAVGTTAGVGVVVGVAAHQGEQIAAVAPLRSFWGGGVARFRQASSAQRSLFARKIGRGRGGQDAERDRGACPERERTKARLRPARWKDTEAWKHEHFNLPTMGERWRVLKKASQKRYKKKQLKKNGGQHTSGQPEAVLRFFAHKPPKVARRYPSAKINTPCMSVCIHRYVPTTGCALAHAVPFFRRLGESDQQQQRRRQPTRANGSSVEALTWGGRCRVVEHGVL